MPNVSFVHPTVRRFLPLYETIRDCLAGEVEVKRRRQKYLPMPNAEDQSKENVARYQAYITRAVFYNVAQRTQGGLVGQIFMRSPGVEVPDALKPVVEDATGSGVPLDQTAAEASSFVVAYGRCGLYCDYPSVEASGAEVDDTVTVSKADIDSGTVRPVIQVVPPWDCINHRVKKRGAKIILAMVVFREDYILEDDGFETTVRDQYRVLRLTKDDEYVIEIYRNKMGTKPDFVFYPKDASGKPIDTIPFTFVGVQNNDSYPAIPPMYDLCALNIAHYRNSADYEEATYMLGQPTPWFSGLTEEWVDKVMKGGVGLGARGGIMLPVDGAAGLLQVEPNTMSKEAMDQKEAQMIALGAKLVEATQAGGVASTATEAAIDNVSETSILSSVAKNTATGIVFILQCAGRFVGAATEAIKYNMNTEFDLTNMDANERAQLLKEFQSNAITFSEYRLNMKRAGIATLPDEEAKKELNKQAEDALSKAVAEAEAIAATQPEPTAGASGAGGGAPKPAAPKPKPGA